MNDFNIFAANYNRSQSHPDFDPRADFNNDGTVNMNDFNIFAANYNARGAQLPAGYSSKPAASAKPANVISKRGAEKGGGACNALGFGTLALLVLVGIAGRRRR